MRSKLSAPIGMILLALLPLGVRAQEVLSKPSSYLSTVGTNSTLIYGGGAVLLQWVYAVNTNATTYFLKIYNKATAPTCGTDTPFMRIPLPQGPAGIPVDGAQFPLGIGFCLTGGIADADTSNAAAGIALNFGVAPQ